MPLGQSNAPPPDPASHARHGSPRSRDAADTEAPYSWGMASGAFCPSCGSPAPAGARYCANCGTALHAASPSQRCCWARLRNFTGENDILANDNVSGRAIVSIRSSDKGFKTAGCGAWTTR